MLAVRVEPLQAKVKRLAYANLFTLVRVERIELSSPAWKAGIIATIQHPRTDDYSKLLPKLAILEVPKRKDL